MEYLEVYRSPDFYNGLNPVFDGPPEGGLYMLHFKRRVYQQQGRIRGSSGIDAYFHVPYSAVLWMAGLVSGRGAYARYDGRGFYMSKFGNVFNIRGRGFEFEVPVANISIEVDI